jgi:hypothetical protein
MIIQLFLKFAARKATGAAPCSRYTGGNTAACVNQFPFYHRNYTGSLNYQ